jgi:hypothetical protein
MEPVYESSGRVPKWWKHSFTIEFLLTSHTSPQSDPTGVTSVDLNFETLKRALQVPGGRLEFSINGLGVTTQVTQAGDANTYVVSSVNDLDFGPKPTLLTWEQVGSARAVRVQWSVEFAITTCCWGDINSDGVCDNAPLLDSSNLRFTEFNYSMSFDVDEEGWSRRSLVGSAEIPGTFEILQNGFYGNTIGAGENPVPNISRYVDLSTVQNKITNLFPRLPGFNRSFAWDVSRDGRRVDWRITDTEIHSDEPYLNRIIKCDVQHSITASRPFFAWDCGIKGSFTVQSNSRKSDAWLAFLMIVRSRLIALQLAGPQVGNNQLEKSYNTGQNKTVNSVPTYIPEVISITDSIYSRTVEFDFKYRVFCTFTQIMMASGLFRPVYGNDWETWQTTMDPALFSGRGGTNISAGGLSGIVVQCTQPQGATNNGSPVAKTSPLSLSQLFGSGCPPMDKSWLEYKIWFTIESVVPTVVHNKAVKISQEDVSDASTAVDPIKSSLPEVSLPAKRTYNEDGSRRAVVQNTSTYHYLVTMHGYGLRVCYGVGPPVLKSFNGAVNLVNTRDEITPNYRIGSVGPMPTYASRWSRTYKVVGTPPNGDGQTNVKLGSDGNNGVPEEVLKDKMIDTIITL